MTSIGRNLYFLFIVSWFLHLPARIPALGFLRLDLVLVLILSVIAILTSSSPGREWLSTPIDKALRLLIAYMILTIPFVYWPGSVIKLGLPEFIKAVVFYYFTVAFLVTREDLKAFISVFLTCQVVRVLEPLYLHVVDGYWGSVASMLGGTQFLDRLSGGPYDVLGPNGLAFLSCTVVSFLYFMASYSWKHRLACIVLIPPCIYALSLTGSRSGILALAVVALGIVIKSKQRVPLAVLFVVVGIVGFSYMSPDMQDRYLSTVGLGQKSAATAEERVDGMAAQFTVALRRPLFGHGLGTSPEANYHFTNVGPYDGRDIRAHNLYIEVMQELGIIGLLIYLFFMKSVIVAFVECRRVNWTETSDKFLPLLIDAIQVWLAMSVIFSFASYGLSVYDWYLIGGLAVVALRLKADLEAKSDKPVENSADKSVHNWHKRRSEAPGN